MKRKILVIGCGSIGERHIRCFLKTGRAEPAACEVRSEVRQRVQEQYSVDGYDDFQRALEETGWDAAIICTPADTHIEFAMRCLQRGLHLLIEKPLSISLNGIVDLQRAVAEAGRFVRVGYTWHFWPGLKMARQLIRSGEVGAPLHAAVIGGQHFPTFRPAYRETYYTRHDTGGGAIQDSITHNINSMEWLIGPITRLYCEAAHQHLPGVTVEDTVCLTARHGAVLATYGHNQFQPPNELTFWVHCEQGSLKLEVHEQRLGIWRRSQSQWEYQPAPLKERDDMFIAQANAFLDGLEGAETDLATLEEGVQTLKVNLAALESTRTAKAITL